MSPIKKIREWLNTFPGIDRIDEMRVDYYSTQPDNGSIDPSGIQVISTKTDILGNKTVDQQYNFGLYYVFAKEPGDDASAESNADWLLEFQTWVNEQSLLHLAPTFGDVPETEQIKAQNGSVAGATMDGVAVYMVQLSVYFTKKYEVK